jgi:shikimate dehydrogenase
VGGLQKSLLPTDGRRLAAPRMTDPYAVIGNPVEHSRSPAIHAAFARAAAQDVTYGRIRAPLTGFREAVASFRAAGGRGLNVTLPFKHEAWDFVDERAGHAAEAGAVNTIDFREGGSVGYNTDGIGLVTDIERNLGFPIGGKRVLVMGAGGASHGVMPALLAARPERVVVANRTLDKAIALAARFRKAAGGRPVEAAPYDKLDGSGFELVINATSAGLAGEMPPVPRRIFAPQALAYDMVYGRSTPFLQFAQECGARAVDGLGMLVEQAAESFLIWRGVRPATKPVIDRLRREERGERREA